MPRSLAAVEAPRDNLDKILALAWKLLAEGVTQRHAALHTPSLATLGLDGRPAVRTVVLRGVDPLARRLRFHTDRRSNKAAEIEANQWVAVHGYDAVRKIQLRLDGRAQLHRDDAIADDAWAASRPFSRACYRVIPAPGDTVADPNDVIEPDQWDGDDPGRQNFCAVVVQVEALEWLYLSAQGHRRARFEWHDGRQSARWLVP